CFLSIVPRPPTSTLFPYTTLFRSLIARHHRAMYQIKAQVRDLGFLKLVGYWLQLFEDPLEAGGFLYSAMKVSDSNPFLLCSIAIDRKSTRLNSSHVKSSYAVFCLN